MTRINLVPPCELMDQHLFAEFREIKMIAPALKRSLTAYGTEAVLARIPSKFLLGTGHVMFFYNKGAYLFERYQEIRRELGRRCFNFDRNAELDPRDVFMQNPEFLGTYVPTEEALSLVRQRIALRISAKPDWYRLTAVNK